MEHTSQETRQSPSPDVGHDTRRASDDRDGHAHLLKSISDAAAAGQYDRAVSLSSLHSADDPVIANARGVCLMRDGRLAEALDLFRWLVMNPGCTWIRTDRPNYFLTNYATILLLTGHWEDCLAVLREVKTDSAVVKRLRAVFQAWEATLTFGQKLHWWVHRAVPPDHPIEIDFTPGEFGPPYDNTSLRPCRHSKSS
jgi:hypothetical protein